MTNPPLFVLAVLTVLITPGPTNTLLFTSGATVGISRSLRLLVAEFAGYNLGILTAGFVLAPWIAGTAKARRGRMPSVCNRGATQDLPGALALFNALAESTPWRLEGRARGAAPGVSPPA